MREYQFEGVIKASEAGSGGAYVEFPYNVEKEFGVKGRVKVDCYFDGINYRGSLVKMGTPCHIIGIPKAIREKIGKEVGDRVKIRLYRDERERVVELHPLLSDAFRKDQSLTLQTKYEKLSYTKKKEIFNQLASAKKAETQQSRLEKILLELKNS